MPGPRSRSGRHQPRSPNVRVDSTVATLRALTADREIRAQKEFLESNSSSHDDTAAGSRGATPTAPTTRATNPESLLLAGEEAWARHLDRADLVDMTGGGEAHAARRYRSSPVSGRYDRLYTRRP